MNVSSTRKAEFTRPASSFGDNYSLFQEYLCFF